jgi:hypothetical protein
VGYRYINNLIILIFIKDNKDRLPYYFVKKSKICSQGGIVSYRKGILPVEIDLSCAILANADYAQ